jgi:hypothetical protein
MTGSSASWPTSAPRRPARFSKSATFSLPSAERNLAGGGPDRDESIRVRSLLAGAEDPLPAAHAAVRSGPSGGRPASAHPAGQAVTLIVPPPRAACLILVA